jgi:hypothetical protein
VCFLVVLSAEITTTAAGRADMSASRWAGSWKSKAEAGGTGWEGWINLPRLSRMSSSSSSSSWAWASRGGSSLVLDDRGIIRETAKGAAW